MDDVVSRAGHAELTEIVRVLAHPLCELLVPLLDVLRRVDRVELGVAQPSLGSRDRTGELGVRDRESPERAACAPA
jgi:hypothetical protein